MYPPKDALSTPASIVLPDVRVGAALRPCHRVVARCGRTAIHREFVGARNAKRRSAGHMDSPRQLQLSSLAQRRNENPTSSRSATQSGTLLEPEGAVSPHAWNC